jgi:hypothetical protein
MAIPYEAMKVLAVLIVALVFAGVAAADIYTDSTGEDPASADISTVTITNDPTAKTISFQVAIANMPTIEDGAEIDIYLDTDLNQATGGADGAEYVFEFDDTDSVLAAWDGAEFNDTGATDLTSSYSNGVLSVQFGVADIGSPSGFNFVVGTLRGPDPNNPAIDQAPDTGFWTYTLHTKSSPPPPTTTTTTSTTPTTTTTTTPTPPPGKKVTVSSTRAVYTGKPTAGKSFAVRGLRVRLSTGVVAGATDLECSATLAGKAFKGTGKTRCDFHLATRAKGKRLIIHARGKYRTTAVRATVSWKIA